MNQGPTAPGNFYIVRPPLEWLLLTITVSLSLYSGRGECPDLVQKRAPTLPYGRLWTLRRVLSSIRLYLGRLVPCATPTFVA